MPPRLVSTTYIDTSMYPSIACWRRARWDGATGHPSEGGHCTPYGVYATYIWPWSQSLFACREPPIGNGSIVMRPLRSCWATTRHGGCLRRRDSPGCSGAVLLSSCHAVHTPSMYYRHGSIQTGSMHLSEEDVAQHCFSESFVGHRLGAKSTDVRACAKLHVH